MTIDLDTGTRLFLMIGSIAGVIAWVRTFFLKWDIDQLKRELKQKGYLREGNR